jgi:hypothetical protein
MTVRILDLTPGNRGIWFDKDDPRATFAPTDSDGFNLIVFDPPHVNTSERSNMAKDYGHYTAKEIRDFIVVGAREAYGRGATNSFMAFKWNDHGRKLSSILELMAPWWEPLFGQRTATRTARGNSTYWVLLVRRDAEVVAE